METKLVCVFVIFFDCFSCDWIFLGVYEPFYYRLPVNMNNYTEKGQTESLGNGRCTDEKKKKKKEPAAGLIPNVLLLSSKLPNSLLSRIVFYNKPSRSRCEKMWLIYDIFAMSKHATGKTYIFIRPAVTGFGLFFFFFFSYFKLNIHYESVRFLSSTAYTLTMNAYLLCLLRCRWMGTCSCFRKPKYGFWVRWIFCLSSLQPAVIKYMSLIRKLLI